MEILAIIPARSGSKSIPHKNIRPINGKPMLAYSIEHALASRWITRVIVSTDSEEYAEIAKQYGAEVPFLRPAEYAKDDSLDIEVFLHALTELKKQEGYNPEIVVQLRPTYPIRKIEDIDAMIQLMISNELCDSVRSIAKAKEIPYKMWKKTDDGRILPLISEIPECYNMPRQQLPEVYYQNACIDIIRTRVILEQHSMSGTVILGYEMEQNYDIDTEEEWMKAEQELKKQEELKKITAGGLKFVFDIDGVIAKLQPQNKYELAKPNETMIHIINKLYDYGNTIVLNTARGYVTGIDWSKITKEQLERWGVKYHELYFGKPNATYYIDDRMLDMNYLIELMKDTKKH